MSDCNPLKRYLLGTISLILNLNFFLDFQFDFVLLRSIVMLKTQICREVGRILRLGGAKKNFRGGAISPKKIF